MTKKYKPQITVLNVEIKNDKESILTLDISDEFVKWFKVTHNLKRWAPKQFKEWLIKALETEVKKI